MKNMNKKKISIKNISKLRTKSTDIPDELADSWVVGKKKELTKKVDETRLTIVIPTDLYKSIKKNCVDNSTSMKNIISKVLSEKFQA